MPATWTFFSWLYSKQAHIYSRRCMSFRRVGGKRIFLIKLVKLWKINMNQTQPPLSLTLCHVEQQLTFNISASMRERINLRRGFAFSSPTSCALNGVFRTCWMVVPPSVSTSHKLSPLPPLLPSGVARSERVLLDKVPLNTRQRRRNNYRTWQRSCLRTSRFSDFHKSGKLDC